MEFIELVLSNYFYIITLSIVTTIIGFGFLLSSKYSENIKHKKIGGILFGQVFMFGLIGAMFNIISGYQYREDLKEFLNEKNIVLSIEDSIVHGETKEFFLSILQTVTEIGTNHSTTTKSLRITLKSKIEQYYVDIKRDSNDESTYWIFVSNKKIINKYIGKIQTKTFDKFNFK